MVEYNKVFPKCGNMISTQNCRIKAAERPLRHKRFHLLLHWIIDDQTFLQKQFPLSHAVNWSSYILSRDTRWIPGPSMIGLPLPRTPSCSSVWNAKILEVALEWTEYILWYHQDMWGLIFIVWSSCIICPSRNWYFFYLCFGKNKLKK